MARSLDVAVVGYGNYGSALVHACVATGIPLREVVVRDSMPAEDLPFVRFEDAGFDAKLIWLCVRDGQIAETARQIASRRRSMKGQIVVHASGSLSVQALAAAKRARASVASAAPVMSFPTRSPVPLKDVLFAVEAEPALRRTLYALIRRLGGRAFAIQSRKKPLYHAAATLASPLLVSELSAAMATARLAGLSAQEAREWLAALAQATVQNVFTRGEAQSFSGPFARGDAATIELHLKALAEHPMLTGIYRSLAAYAMESLPVQRRDALRGVLMQKKTSA